MKAARAVVNSGPGLAPGAGPGLGAAGPGHRAGVRAQPVRSGWCASWRPRWKCAGVAAGGRHPGVGTNRHAHAGGLPGRADPRPNFDFPASGAGAAGGRVCSPPSRWNAAPRFLTDSAGQAPGCWSRWTGGRWPRPMPAVQAMSRWSAAMPRPRSNAPAPTRPCARWRWACPRGAAARCSTSWCGCWPPSCRSTSLSSPSRTRVVGGMRMLAMSCGGRVLQDIPIPAVLRHGPGPALPATCPCAGAVPGRPGPARTGQRRLRRPSARRRGRHRAGHRRGVAPAAGAAGPGAGHAEDLRRPGRGGGGSAARRRGPEAVGGRPCAMEEQYRAIFEVRSTACSCGTRSCGWWTSTRRAGAVRLQPQ